VTDHQPSMFGGAEIVIPPEAKGLARRDDPGTSKQSAEGVKGFAGDHYEKIVSAMAAMNKPCGAEQIEASLLSRGYKLAAYQIRKRLPELQKAQRVRVALDRGTGAELTRATSSGRHERLWELPGAGG
jgi:hypothetical protein